MLLAALAGIFYGGTYLRTGSVTPSAITHALVNFVWGLFFRTEWHGKAQRGAPEGLRKQLACPMVGRVRNSR